MRDAHPLNPVKPAWGKLNSGQSFGILAVDMDRAFRAALLSPTENLFLGEVRETCWGAAVRLRKKPGEEWPDAARCRINLTHLAEQLGISRQQLGAAKKRLIQARVLIEDEDGWLGINKQADEWINPRTGEPRLTPDMVTYCQRAQPGSAAAQQASFEFARTKVNPRAPHQTTAFDVTTDGRPPRPNACSDRARTHAATAPKRMQSGPVAYRNGREQEIPETNKEAAARPARDRRAGAAG